MSYQMKNAMERAEKVVTDKYTGCTIEFGDNVKTAAERILEQCEHDGMTFSEVEHTLTLAQRWLDCKRIALGNLPFM